MNYRFVTFNGPIGSGKSWVCNQLQNCKRLNPSNSVFRRASFQDSLMESTRAILGAGPEVSYDEFKVTRYNGITGRQWMIDLATRARENDEFVFSRTLIARVKRMYRPTDVILVDSSGFENELDFLRVAPEVDVLACSIEPKGSPERGQLWSENDSRYNLAHKCAVVTQDSSAMLEAVEAALVRRGWLK